LWNIKPLKELIRSVNYAIWNVIALMNNFENCMGKLFLFEEISKIYAFLWNIKPLMELMRIVNYSISVYGDAR